jgi:hypothetical protein
VVTLKSFFLTQNISNTALMGLPHKREKLLVYSIFTVEYSRELFYSWWKEKWHNTVLDLIIMRNETFGLLQMLKDVG